MGCRAYVLVSLAGLEAPDVLRGESAINLASMADLYAISPTAPEDVSRLPPDIGRMGQLL
jgi:hypothetical protein